MTAVLRLALRISLNAATGKPPGHGLPVRPEDYGLSVEEASARQRVEEVFRAFFTGMETGVRRSRDLAAGEGGVTPLFRPFYWEGGALGGEARSWFSLRSSASRMWPLPPRSRPPSALKKGRNEMQSTQRKTRRDAEKISRGEETAPFAFMRVVGIGFLHGLVPPRKEERLSRAARRCGNLGPLIHDGYGFATGLFRWRGTVVKTARPLEALPGFARLAALNGLGRSLWFRFMDRPELGMAEARRARDPLALLGGMGLAAAFTFPDELHRAYDVASALAGEEKSAFLKGIRIALFVRDRYQKALLDELLESTAGAIRERARTDRDLAREVHRVTCSDAEYIRLFHEGCLRADPSGAPRSVEQ